MRGQKLGTGNFRNFCIPKVMHFFNIGEFWDVFPHIFVWGSCFWNLSGWWFGTVRSHCGRDMETGSLMNSQAMWQQRDLETGGATDRTRPNANVGRHLDRDRIGRAG